MTDQPQKQTDALEALSIPDDIWICPSGNQTYSTNEGNSTPELKYTRALSQGSANCAEVEMLTKIRNDIFYYMTRNLITDKGAEKLLGKIKEDATEAILALRTESQAPTGRERIEDGTIQPQTRSNK